MKYLLLLLFPVLVKAQTNDEGKVIIIHPAVGKTITADNKKQYHLFPQYKDSLFSSAEVTKYNDTTYSIAFKTITGQTIEKSATTEELNEIYHQIDEIHSESLNSTQEKAAKRSRNKSRWNGIIFFQSLLLIAEILIVIAA